MVSFSCEVCNDTIVKKKLTGHFRQCPNAYFTCIDCSTTFQGDEFLGHTSCISEAEKYQKALYKGKKAAPPKSQPTQQPTPDAKPLKANTDSAKVSKPTKETKEAKPIKETKTTKEKHTESGLASLVKDGKSVDLAKILKKLQGESKKDKKELLKELVVRKNAAGELVLSLGA